MAKAKGNETKEEARKRIERNKRARARHWRQTGVSEGTVNWMRNTGQL